MVKFYLNRPKAAKTPIIAAIAAFGFRIRYSTGITIQTALWDERNQQMKPLTDICRKINASLNAIREKADDIITSHKVDRLTLGPDELLNLMQHGHNKKTAATFAERFADFTADKARLNTPLTMKRYQSALHLINEYKPGTARITAAYVADFTKWLLERKYSANYVRKITGVLTSFAAYSGEAVVNPVKIKNTSASRVYMSRTDLDKLEAVTIRSAPLARIRDIFLFACWTGMRHSDLVRFNPSMVVEVQGVQCLNFISKKTGGRSVVPLHRVCLEVLNRYGGVIPRVPTDQRYNVMIKEVCRLAGITEMVQVSKLQGESRVPYSTQKYKAVSSHTARRSFVSNMSSLGLNSRQIGKLIGNTKVVDTYDLAEPELNALTVSKLI